MNVEYRASARSLDLFRLSNARENPVSRAFAFARPEFRLSVSRGKGKHIGCLRKPVVDPFATALKVGGSPFQVFPAFRARVIHPLQDEKRDAHRSTFAAG